MMGISTAYLRSADHVYGLMKARGYQPSVGLAVLERAFELAQPKINRVDLLSEVRAFFLTKARMVPDDLDRLPSCWLRALPGLLWATKDPRWDHLPYMIRQTGLERGVLCLAFAQEQPPKELRLTRGDALRIHLNQSLEPNRWQALSGPMEHDIWPR